MSKATVPSNINNNTLFRDWLITINEILDEEREIYDVLATKAPKKHSSSGTGYGVGTSTLYGHLKLTDVPAEDLDATKGTALAPNALYEASSSINERITTINNDLTQYIDNSISNVNAQIAEIEDNFNNYAPKYHAVNDPTIYGSGTATLYGHLKLSDLKNSDLDVNSGTAATPKALNDVYNELIDTISDYNIDETINSIKVILNKLNGTAGNNTIDIIAPAENTSEYTQWLNEWNSKSNVNHASVETIYGLGNETHYGHLKITSNFENWTDKTSTDKTVSLKFISDFYNYIQENLNNITSSIDDLTANLDNYAIKNHASEETTYGLGTTELYGHLKVTDVFNNETSYELDDSIAVSANAFQLFLYGEEDESQGIDNDGYFETIDNINERIDNIITEISDFSDEIVALKNEDILIHNEIDALDNRIEEIENNPALAHEIYFFSTDLSINSSNISNHNNYIAYVTQDNSSDSTTVTVGATSDNYRFYIKNESVHTLNVVPDNNTTIDGTTMPIILGENDSIEIIQNPVQENTAINYTVLSRKIKLDHSTYQTVSGSIITVSMATNDADYFDINTQSCELNITTGVSSASSKIELSEKYVVLHANVATQIEYPNDDFIWMNNTQQPQWGDAGETLILKLLQVGDKVYATAMHNSQIVDDLHGDVKLTQNNNG